MKEMQGTFYEFHNYKVKTNFTTRLTMMILAAAVATFLTNPIDVVLSKILTQDPKRKDGARYKGMI